jgi:hypothetical protein
MCPETLSHLAGSKRTLIAAADATIGRSGGWVGLGDCGKVD